MKAALIENYGDIGQLIYTQTQTPVIAANQLLIKVHAAGVNPVDCYIRGGMFEDTGTHSLPLTLGWDTAGTVEQVGKAVTKHKVGDQVFAMAPFDRNGSYAEYLAIEANLVVSKPKNLSFAQSAAVPLAALTAWQGLFTEGKLQAGQRVLIHNTSGGVGSFAVQLAKAAGAHVIGTASAKNREFVEGLGVDQFIDYQNSKFEDETDPVDLVFAGAVGAVGGDDVVTRSLDVIKSGGHLISLFDEIDEALALERGVTYHKLMVQPNAADLTQIKDLLEQGKVQVHLDSLFPLADAQLAHQRSESKRTVGKIVLQVIAD